MNTINMLSLEREQKWKKAGVPFIRIVHYFFIQYDLGIQGMHLLTRFL